MSREFNQLVSVIIPIYKVEQYLHLCVNSVLAQTYRNLEIILVDDGSPDGCPAICDEYARQDSRVRVIHQVNAGLSMARNAGIDVCTGAYITFVDSDDLLHERFVERLLAACEQTGAAVAVGAYRKDTLEANLQRCTNDLPSSAPTVISGREANLRMYDQPQWARMITAWGKLFRRELLVKERFPAIKLHEDEALIYKLLYRAERVALVDDAVYYYSQNPSSLMANRFTPERMTMVGILDERLAFYAAHGETGDLIRFTQNRQFMFAAVYFRQTVRHAPKAWKFRRSLRKKQWALYGPLMRSAYPRKRKRLYTYAMLLPVLFNDIHF